MWPATRQAGVAVGCAPSHHHRSSRAGLARDPSRSAGGGQSRIAVLPVENLTGDPAADYLADGLTDELISALGQLGPRDLAVIARTSVMTYRKAPKSIADIGRELNVSMVVESSVRREAGTLRVGSNLVAVADQTPIATWSEMFGQDDVASAESQMNAAMRLAHLIALELLPHRTGEAPALVDGERRGLGRVSARLRVDEPRHGRSRS